LLVGAIALAAAMFRNPGGQSVDWSFPYFSGAANFGSFGEWHISPSEYAAVRGMSIADYREHRHLRAQDTLPYTYNNYGYVLVVLAARTWFPWLGEGDAVALLQCVAHVAICLGIFSLLGTPVQRWAFVLLYAVNPVVLRLVTYPYYYFWSALPCALLAVVWLRRDRIGWWIMPTALALFVAWLIRPPVLFVCLLVFALAFRAGQRIATASAALVFAALVALASPLTYSSPWHTVYVGIGAYENPYGLDGPYDEHGYALYQRVTGMRIDMNPVDGSFQRAEERERYWRVLRENYLQIARERPLMLLRNAAFNTAEAFALGYDVDRRWVTLLSGLGGVAMIALIAGFRLWTWGLGILCYAAAFTPYFPPIPAYLFGAYLLSALAAGDIAERLLGRAPWRQLVRSGVRGEPER
jgi:hypothetical protein